MDSKSGKPTSVSSTKEVKPTSPNLEISKPEPKKPTESKWGKLYTWEGNQSYRHKDGNWYKYTYTDQNGKSHYETKVTDINNVKKLEEHFKTGEFVKGYPGKEEKDYLYKNGVWKEADTKNAKYKTITDAGRVAELNRHFGKQASTSVSDKIFTGYPGKEANEYKVTDNGVWMKRAQGKETWSVVTNEGSIKSLNKQFEKDIDPNKADLQDIAAKNAELNSLNHKIDSYVTSNLVDDREGAVVSVLSKQFPQFKFEETQAGADRMIVSLRGSDRPEDKIEIMLDNWRDSEDAFEAKRLRDFMKARVSMADTRKNLEMKEGYFLTQQVERQQAAIRGGMGERDFTQPELIINKDGNVEYAKAPETKPGEKTMKDWEAKQQLTTARKEYMADKSSYMKNLKNSYERGDISRSEFGSAVAAIKVDDEEMRRVGEFANDINIRKKKLAEKEAFQSQYISEVQAKLNSGEISQSEYEATYKPQIEALNKEIESGKSESAIDNKNLTISLKAMDRALAENRLIQEQIGSTGGAMMYNLLQGATTLGRFAGMTKEDQDALIRDITGIMTTDEWMGSEHRSFLQQAAMSTTSSIGAMIPKLIPGVGQAASLASLFGLGFFEMKDELDNATYYNEKTGKVEKIPAEQKLLMSAAYGTVSMFLEKMGLDELVTGTAGKKLAMNVLKDTAKQLTKNAPKEYIENLLISQTKTRLQEAGLKIGVGMATEGVTESLQSLASVSTKEIYDELKGKDFFENKSAWEIAGDVAYEGALGAAGGGMVSSVITGTQLTAQQRRESKYKEQIAEMIAAAETNGSSEAVMTTLKAKIIKGEMTADEAKEIARNFSIIKSKVDEMPNNLSEEGKAASLDLMLEKDKLNKAIQGKDPNLVKPQRDRIAEIDNRLQEIAKENAVQERSTEEVLPRESEAVREARGQREGVGQEVKGETITKEGVQAVEQEEIVQSEENQALIDDYIQNRIDYINSTTIPQEAKDGLIEDIKSDPIEYAKRLKEVEGKEGREKGTPHTDFLNSLQRQPTTQETAITEEQAPVVQETVQPDVQEAPVVEGLAPEEQQQLDEFESILADEGFAFEEEVAPETELAVEEVVVPPPPSRKGKGVSSKTQVQETPVAEETQAVEELASQDDLIEEENLIEEVKNSDDNIAEAKQRAKDAIAKVKASKWSETRKRTEIAKIREKEKEEVENSRGWKKEFESKLKSVQKRIAKARAKAQPVATPAKKAKKTAKQIKEEFIAEVDAQIKRVKDISGMKLAELENKKSRLLREGKSTVDISMEIEDLKIKRKADIKALESKKNNPSALNRFRKRGQEAELADTRNSEEQIAEEMNKMPEEEKAFEEPTVSGEVEINPTEDSKQPKSVIDKVLKFLGLKDKGQMLRKIEDFDGIPMIMAMSDILSSGKIKDAMGNLMVVDGGLGFNTFGRNMELAWAGVTKEGAQKQYDEAVKLYEANKELFDRLWAEGKIPKGHIPMAVMRMTNTAVNSNEAVFRYVLPYIQSLPLENRKAALDSLLKGLQSKAEGNSSTIWYTELSEKLDNGELKSVEDVKEFLNEIISNEKTEEGKLKKAKSLLNKISSNKDGVPRTIDDVIEEVNEKVEKIVPFMISNYITENNIETLDGLFEAIIDQAKKRAKGEMNMFSLPIRAYLYNSFFSKESKPEEVAKRKAKGESEYKKNNLDVIKTLLNGVEGAKPEMFTSDYIYQRIGDPSMMKAKMGDIVGVMGIDVLNGGVAKSTHNNYGYGPKGRLISFISNPKQGVDVFPEFRAKAARVFKQDKKGNYPNADAVANQTGGAFFMDSAFRGAKARFGKIGDLDMLIGKLRFAFPEVSVTTTESEFNEFLNKEGVKKREKDGTVIYGVTKDGKIFLNPSYNTLRTPIHEFGHIWIDYLRSDASKKKGTMLLKKGFELVDGTPEYERALKEYGDRETALEEALVELLAVKGDTIINAAKKSEFKSWMNAMFKYIKDTFVRSKNIANDKIKDLTLDEFINIGLADLFSGERVSNKFDARLAESASKARKSKQNVVNNIVEIGRAKGISDAVIKEALKKRGYTNAQITEALTTEAETTQAPIESLNEFLDSINTVVKEYAAAARKKVRGDMKAKRAVLTAKLKAMQASGSITAKQAQALLEKVNKLNMSNSVAVDRFVQFAQNVFKNAEYVNSVSTINNLLPTVRKNLKRKLGVADSVVPMAQRLMSIKPTFIPMEVFDKYKAIVETLGKRQAELSLPEINDLRQDLSDILEAVDVESGLAVELAERLVSYPDKVTDNGKVQYTETINKMLEDGLINEYEHGIMKKYKSLISPIERTKKTEAELEGEKSEMITSLRDASIDESNLPMREEKMLALKLGLLLKSEALEHLSAKELNDLMKVVDNINNGFITNRAEMLFEKMNGILKTNNLINPINNVRVMFGEKLKSKAKKIITRQNYFKSIIEGNSSIFLDEVLGNFREKPFYKNVYEPIAKALSSFTAENRRILDGITDMEKRLAKHFKRNPNKIVMSKYKMMTWLIQNEFESNPGNKQVNQAIDFLNKTIKETMNENTYYSENDIKMFNEIIDEFSKTETDENGNEKKVIDSQKIYDSFSQAEKDILADIRNINNSLTDKAVYTAAVIRGSRINPINNYISLSVIDNNTGNDEFESIGHLRNVFDNSRTTSTRAKTLIERTGAVSAINFDPFSSVKKSASSVLMDYHLTPAIREGRFVLSELEKSVDSNEDGTVNEDKRPLVNAIRDSYNKIVDTSIGNAFLSGGIMDETLNEAMRQGYRAMLGSVPRAIAELMSNMSYIAFKGQTKWIKGTTQLKTLMSTDAFDIMKNVGSVQTNRIFSTSTISNQMVSSEIFNQTSGIKGSKAKSGVANAAQLIYNQSLKRVKNTAESVADKLISSPDMVMMRPLWFGSFMSEFEKIAGEKADFEKLASNDEAYMKENADAIEKAREVADMETAKAGSSDNAALGILKNTITPDDKGFTKWYKRFNSFMGKFLIFEYMQARSGVNMLVKGGLLEKKEGVAIMAACTARMTTYGIVGSMLGNTMVESFAQMFGYSSGDDEDDVTEKSVWQQVGRALTSSMTTMMFGRNLGNVARVPLNIGIEYLNENYLDALRNGEYDPYKDALQYTIIPPEKAGQEGKGVNLTDIAVNTLGAATPFVKAGIYATKKLTEDEKKTPEAYLRQQKERNIRVPFEIGGTLGYVPFYKDIRKIGMDWMYGELKKDDKSGKPKTALEMVKREKTKLKNNIKSIVTLRANGKISASKESELIEKYQKIYEDRVNEISNR